MKVKPLALFFTALLSGASCSAMAWSGSGSGGTISISGTFTPSSSHIPWQVKSGNVSGLDAEIAAGSKVADIKLKKSTLLVGIRTKATSHFTGASGVSPQVNFGGKIDMTSDLVANSLAPLKLDVMDESGVHKIGALTAKVFAAGELSFIDSTDNANKGVVNLYASTQNDVFYGGLPNSAAKISSNPRDIIRKMDPDVVANFVPVEGKNLTTNTKLIWDYSQYNGYYGAGINVEDNIQLTLDKPIQGSEPLKWKASLPVTISYA